MLLLEKESKEGKKAKSGFFGSKKSFFLTRSSFATTGPNWLQKTPLLMVSLWAHFSQFSCLVIDGKYYSLNTIPSAIVADWSNVLIWSKIEIAHLHYLPSACTYTSTCYIPIQTYPLRHSINLQWVQETSWLIVISKYLASCAVVDVMHQLSKQNVTS